MAQRIDPVRASALAADHVTVKALQGLDDYRPTSEAYSLALALQLQATLTRAEQAEEDLAIALAQARSVRAETSHRYHDTVVGIRGQVFAQYGPDSSAITLIGLTRKSDRKRTRRRKASAS